MSLNAKKCCRCDTLKDRLSFNKDNSFNDGLRPFCRECSRLEWKARYEQNKSSESIRKRKYYKNNKKAILEKTSAWLKNNREYGRYKVALRRSLGKKAAPPWLDKIHLMQIKWYYQASEMMSKTTGVPYEVDHIYPLKGANFSGLHVPWNLRIIKSSENRSKGNKLPDDEKSAVWL